MNVPSRSTASTLRNAAPRGAGAWHVGFVVLVALLAIPFVPGLNGLAHGQTVSLASAPTSGTSPGSAPSLAQTLLQGAHLSLAQVMTPLSTLRHGPALATQGATPATTPPSTSANFLLTGSDCSTFGHFTPFEPIPFSGSSVIAAPGSNTTLVAATGSVLGVFNASGSTLCSSILAPSPYFGSHGATALLRSTNGGQSWTTTWLAQNKTHWLNTADATNGTINWGQPRLAGASDGTMLVSEIGLPNCWFNLTNYPNNLCGSNATYEEPWSVAVARSTNAGVSWGLPEQVGTAVPVQWVNVTPACSTVFTSGSGLYFKDIVESPSIAINPTNGVAVVSWSVLGFTFDMTTCAVNINAVLEASVSTDSGLTWGTPKVLATLFAAYPQVVIGPAPAYPITIFFDDGGNYSGTATSWGAVTSTTNGSSWGKPSPVSFETVNLVRGLTAAPFASPENEVGLQQAIAAVDTSPTSLYEGSQYIVWSDNQTGSSAGTPAIDVVVAPPGSSSWTAPATISAPGSTIYFNPTVSVGPSGEVLVTYYGYSVGSASYQVYGVLSMDGGTTWSHQFRVTDQVSTPPTGFLDIGPTEGSVFTSNGAYVSWTDCRIAACSSSNDVQTWLANPHAVTLSANVPGVNATVSTFGASQTYPLPALVGWDNASSSSVTVPQFLPDPFNASDVFSFVNFSGLASSTNYQVTVSYSGQPGTLTANYVAVPAAILHGIIGPIVPGLSVKVNNVPIALQPYNATAEQWQTTVPGGLSYPAIFSAPNYQTQTHTFLTAPGATYWWNVTLSKQLGYIVGQLTPPTAQLTVNGTVVTTVDPSTGLFNLPEPFGWYWVNASGTGLTSFSQYVQVLAGQNKTVTISLSGGWVQGVVIGAQPSKPGLSVKLDGYPILVSSAGTFNNSTLGGYHVLTATQSGFNLSSINFFVTPGRATTVNVTLTNKGWLSGLINPLTAAKTSVLHIYSGAVGNYYAVAANGTFNVSLAGNLNYTVNVTSPGYTSFQGGFLVTPGNGTLVPTITLTAIQPCTGPNCGGGGGGGNNTTAPSGISLTTLVIIVVVVVVVAAIAVVLLTRRRGGGGAAEAPAEEPQPVYEESNPADLPRLQSDGSMSSGNRPPPSA